MAKVRSQAGYERSDAPPRLLAALAAGLALTMAIILGALAVAFPHALGPSPRGPSQPLPPQPQLQADPADDLAAYQKVENHRLANYGRTADGHVRMPIDKAMNEVAAKGWSDGK